MSESIDDRLLDYYQRELAYLRQAGEQFARDHPRVARRLALSGHESPDPHVERLLEGFALLTARIQRQLDDEYSQLTDAVLEQLYPFAVRPTPSVGIVRFEADGERPELAAGYTVARDTPLFVTTVAGDTVRFRTTAEACLWPLAVAELRCHSANETRIVGHHPDARAALTIRLEQRGKTPLGQLPIQRLRFHLGGTPHNAAWLFDSLLAHTVGLVVRTQESPQGLPIAGLPEATGFSDGEALYPLEAGVHPALRLLAEYCACPEKYAFVDLPVRFPETAGDWVELNVLLDCVPAAQRSLVPGDMQLGCVPVINLFPQTSDPIRADATRREYRIVPDAHRERSVEAYAVRRIVVGSAAAARPLPHYFACADAGETGPCWHVRRIAARGRLPGSELMLTLVDPDFQLQEAPQSTLTAELLCTNRHLAETLLAGSPLAFERPGPVVQARLIRAPSPQRSGALAGSSRWRLVSQLALNHLSIVDSGDDSAGFRLRELLAVHVVDDDKTLQRRFDGIVELASQRVSAHVGQDAWRGWRNGLEIRLRLDPECFAGSSQVLFTGVLARFFAMYAAANQFVRTVLEDHQGVIKRWPAMEGQRLVL